jgi:hypothetical protein
MLDPLESVLRRLIGEWPPELRRRARSPARSRRLLGHWRAGTGTERRAYASPQLQRALPTRQWSANIELCPEPDLPKGERRHIKRGTKRHIEALLASFAGDPDAFVHTT